MALHTSPEQPAPVRQVATLIGGWLERLGAVWVQGQVAQLNRRQGTSTVFLTLRDALADVSLPVTCPRLLLDSLDPPLVEGAGVVVHGRPSYYLTRGTLSLSVDEIRMVGLGELLARLERRRQLLAAEGLFARERKRPLPFLPHTVGLVTAAGSAAERDVVECARRRWPAVRFQVAYASMQGHAAVREVREALARLDRDPGVDVVVVARGGGSVEDLLPFSDEGLVRAVFATRTPVVSAIGHEPDTPLLDLVADVRAATPTDAAELVVPDVSEELLRVHHLRDRARAQLRGWLAHEERGLQLLRGRPALADPGLALQARGGEVAELLRRSRRTVTHRLDRAADDVGHRLARVRALSPLATLGRGYAVLQSQDGRVVGSAAAVEPGQPLRARLHDGRLDVHVDAVEVDRSPSATSGRALPGGQAVQEDHDVQRDPAVEEER